MTVYKVVLLKYILWLKEKNCGRSMADIPTPSSLADQEITSRIERQKIKWYEWLKEPLLYKVSESSKGRSRYGKTANKKTCNLFWDIHPRTGSKSGCCRLRKVVAESREWFYFFRQNIYMLRVLPTQEKLFCSKWPKPLVWRDSLSNQKSEPTQLAAYQPLS